MSRKNVLIGIGAGIAATAIAFVASSQMRRTIPTGITAVSPFDAQKYLGTWYEIARLDFKYERGLSHVTANYSMNENGSIKVLNRGYDKKKAQWREAHGKALFVEGSDVGMLKVSFFGPFYAGYNVVAIDKEYKYALVCGRNLDYMWILSREKTIPESIAKSYLTIAKKAGYDISALIWTEQ